MAGPSLEWLPPAPSVSSSQGPHLHPWAWGQMCPGLSPRSTGTCLLSKGEEEGLSFLILFPQSWSP